MAGNKNKKQDTRLHRLNEEMRRLRATLEQAEKDRDEAKAEWQLAVAEVDRLRRVIESAEALKAKVAEPEPNGNGTAEGAGAKGGTNG